MGKHNTFLTPKQEKAFRKWKLQHAPHDSGIDYDLRGAFLAGLLPSENGHWSDRFKKPNHPTFSIESQYASCAPERAGSWDGETFIPSTKTQP